MKNKRQALSIYVHVPFCVKKCYYCDFLSAPAGIKEQEKYVEALIKEIKYYCKQFPTSNYELISIFFGGGTPSLLKPTLICQILEEISKYFSFSKDIEISLECNPKTADLEKLRGFYRAGINRLSIGLQTANEEERRRLGRIHTYGEFLDTYHWARMAGFQNLNIDVMAALPGQSLSSYTETLHKVVSLEPEHISAYQLIIEEGTVFFDLYGDNQMQDYGCKLNYPMEVMPLPDEDTERQMYYLTKQILNANGYQRYEISNYSRKGFECRHNLSYWTGIDYLGFGIGASSYIQGVRYRCIQDIGSYQLFLDDKEKNSIEIGSLYENVEKLSEKDKMEEFMFLGLRLIKGISKREFCSKFGKSLESVYSRVLSEMEEKGLLAQEEKQQRIYLTEKGLDLANYVMSAFLLDDMG